MRPYRIGMRWWLAAAFVLIAALTAASVATVSSSQAHEAVRSSSEDLAVGRAVSAAFAVQRALETDNLAQALPVIANRRDLAVFVFDRRGRLLTPSVSKGIHWPSVPGGNAALASALAGHRFVETVHRSGATIVALPLRRIPAAQALVSYAPQPAAYGTSLDDLPAGGPCVRPSGRCSSLLPVGVLAAALIARRLRRIAAAAAAIERGDFDAELNPKLHDEIGVLALSVDRMRERLRASFEQLRADRDRLERLFGQLHEGVIAVDRAPGRPVLRTATAKKIVGSALASEKPLPERWAGVPLRELASGLFRPDAAIAESRTEVDEERTISLVGVPAGSSDLAVIVLADISAQQRRERAERDFVANASHELRTPVSAIIGAVEALQSGAKDSPKDRDEFVGLIERQAMRLERLIRSLLLLARAQTREGDSGSSRCSCGRCSTRSRRRRARATVRRLRLTVPVRSSRSPSETWSNRSSRASSATRSSMRTRGACSSPLAPAGDAVVDRSDRPRLWYSAGHAATDLRSLLQRRAGRREGFGLGLAIVRDTVSALGGSVEIDSEPGRGTTARVTLAAEPRA